MPKYSKQHYEDFATLLGNYLRGENEEAYYNPIEGIADLFEADNARFDRERFLQAVEDRSKKE